MSDKPYRVQLRRTKGWRMPPNTIKVARPSRWGNPYRVGEMVDPWGRPSKVTISRAVELFETDLVHGLLERFTVADVRSELRGKNLACFCKLSEPCHADVLLELANAPAPKGG
jgi:hypothetical protein